MPGVTAPRKERRSSSAVEKENRGTSFLVFLAGWVKKRRRVFAVEQYEKKVTSEAQRVREKEGTGKGDWSRLYA